MNERVESVVERYQQQTPQQRDRLTEETTKTSFITPLFRALGWDTENPSEMAMEDPVSGGRVDYAFRLHGVTRFYLEAKRHSADIYADEYARQVINYAFNKGVPWAVLTNFQRLIVFDAFAQAPRQGPPPRVLDIGWQDYPKAGSGLELLTPEAVVRDLLAERAERTGIRRHSIDLQQELYQAMRGWRESLINQIATAMGYGLDDLHIADEAVQRLLNRLIFLRNCEDRHITEGRLRAIFNAWLGKREKVNLANRFSALFHKAAATYDSELFTTDAHIDNLFPRLGGQIDQVLGEVLTGLYYPPRSWAEYNFRDIDSDVLGAVYEQYLGHVAQRGLALAVRRERQLSLGIQTPGYAVEAKRQRRKEQGIYYTPRWVVDYIVQQTLGSWLGEHGDDPLENLAVLDPACGSGSFLIRAYETLLAHEAGRTNQTPEMLSRGEREHILRHNIYGVDLDPQAVEIARLNLLMRMVREEEPLPLLRENILPANSLVSGGEDALRPWYGDGWESKHPLTWEQTFREVMQRGGFDVIIGNPPYVRIQSLPEEDRDYYRAHYGSAHGSFDIYVLFIERALALLKAGGRLGFITSGKFLKAEYGRKLLNMLQERATVEEIVDLSAQQVFGDATTYPVILILRKGRQERPITYTQVPATATVTEAGQVLALRNAAAVRGPQAVLQEGVWPLPIEAKKLVLEKMRSSGPILLDLATNIFQGLVTSADAVYSLSLRGYLSEDVCQVYSAALGKATEIETALLRPLVRGSSVRRYEVSAGGSLLLFPYEMTNHAGRLVNWEMLRTSFPRTAAYLEENKRRLESREDGKMRRDDWYGYVYPKNLALHGRRKLIVPRLVRSLEAAYDASGRYYLDNVDVGGVLLTRDDDDHYLFVLAVLNSSPADFFFRSMSAPFRGDYRSANRQFIAPIPIPNSVSDVSRTQRIIENVRRVLHLRDRLNTPVGTDTEREATRREIRETDRAIDDLVYDLYGLSAEERRMVEEEVGERG